MIYTILLILLYIVIFLNRRPLKTHRIILQQFQNNNKNLILKIKQPHLNIYIYIYDIVYFILYYCCTRNYCQIGLNQKKRNKLENWKYTINSINLNSLENSQHNFIFILLGLYNNTIYTKTLFFLLPKSLFII